MILKSHHSGRLVWYWYWVDGTHTADPLYAKFLETKTKLVGGRQDAALIAVATDFADEPAEAAAALQAFLDDLGSLEAVFDAAAGATEGRS